MGNCLGQSADSNALNHGDGVTADRSKVIVTKGQKLRRDKLKWKSEIPLTTYHIGSKREEFWDTAPAFEGRQEIWDALRAAVEAIERNDYELAQAIIDGANIILPSGTLRDSYDELGNRYQLPLYVLSYPSNIESSPKIGSAAINPPSQKQSKSKPHSKHNHLRSSKPTETLSDNSKNQKNQLRESQLRPGTENNFQMTLNLRLSTGKDFVLSIDTDKTIDTVKEEFSKLCGFDKARQRWYCYGKMLENHQYLSECTIPPNFIVQVIVHNPGERNTDLL